MTFELIVAGGTVVTAAGSRRADVGVTGGRIAAVDADLGADADRIIPADGLLVLPGIVDVHTHTRVASDTEPDRFFQDSVAAAFGGTTTFLAFNNPGTGTSEDAGRSLMAGLREWQARTSGDSAVDYAVSLVITGQQSDPVGELRVAIDSGVPTFKAFMVYEFGVDDGLLLRVLEMAGRNRGMIEVHCENRSLLEHHTALLLAAGSTGPRYHADSRPPYVEAEATHRALVLAAAVDAPVYVVHLSCREALRHVRAAKAEGRPVFAETCPHYLILSSDRYDAPDEHAARFVISPPLREASQRGSLWEGLADGSLDLVGTDHVPDRLAVEKRTWRESFDRISNGGPGIETLLSLVYSEGVERGRITLERMVDLLATTPARLFGLEAKGALERGRDADLVLFDPHARRTIRQAQLHHTSDYTPYEGMEITGAVRSVFVRGKPVIEDGRFVGGRGHGRFQERRLSWR